MSTDLCTQCHFCTISTILIIQIVTLHVSCFKVPRQETSEVRQRGTEPHLRLHSSSQTGPSARLLLSHRLSPKTLLLCVLPSRTSRRTGEWTSFTSEGQSMHTLQCILSVALNECVINYMLVVIVELRWKIKNAGRLQSRCTFSFSS